MAYQHHASVSPDTLIETKFQCGRTIVRQSLPFKDFDPILLPKIVCELFGVPSTSELSLERYSDTSASFVPMNDPDPNVESNAYKILIRAAKAKKKLRFRVSWKSIVAAAPEVAPAPTTTPVSVLDPFVFSDVSNAASSKGSPCSTASTSSSKLEKTRMEELDIALSKALKSVSIAGIPSPTSRVIYHPEPATLDSGNVTTLPGNSTSVYCNSCKKNFLEEHYHCDTCNDGQFDICPECHDANKRCDSDKHWFIKRTVAPDGTIITSTTQKFVSDSKKQSACQLQEPQQASADTATAVDEAVAKATTDTEDVDSRTCNGCVQILPEHAFVTCCDCPDFDLCFPCLEQGDHGHHPAHTFGPASSSQSPLSPEQAKLCRPGRNVAHQAICDSCDKAIQGVRFKCQDCPDWDYCQDCIHKARINHANHRFAPIYDAIRLSPIHTDYLSSYAIHYGINCDGPLCVSSKLHICGIRYKCTVCNDVDFCANCEASPSLVHNRSHPLIKIRSPIRGCSVTTKVDCPTATVYLGDHIASHRRCHRNDQGHGKSKPNKETEVESSQPVVKKDAELLQQIKGKNLEHNTAKEDIKAKEPEQEDAKENTLPKSVKPDEHYNQLTETATPRIVSQYKSNDLSHQHKLAIKQFYHSGDLVRCQTQFPRELDAEFVLDYIKDGSVFIAGSTFIQRWVLKNSGPKAWPAGCSIRFVGGDLMLGAKTTESGSTRQCTETNAVGHEVLPGQSFGFDIALKASTDPKDVGCFISYWRLHTPSGKPFGPRVWCHINLVPAVAVEGRSSSKKESAPTSALAAFLKQAAEKNKEVKDVDMASLRAQVYALQAAERQPNKVEALRQLGIIRGLEKVADARRSLLGQGLYNRQTFSHVRKQQMVPTVVNGSTQTAEAKTAIVESPVATDLQPNAEFQVIAVEPVVVQSVSKPVVVEKAAIVVATEEKAEVAHLEAPAVTSATPTLMEIVDMIAGEDETTEIEKFDQEDLVLFEDAETISVTDSEGDSEGVPLFEDDDYELLQTSDEESVA